ncbi:ABC transporter permease [Heliophilum fasciatum]|uniref:NitT/TauT family transport system permease protein n=1 Tax=Heliophilum fasciatum TaxID=35700 RepID=A0A4R2RK03_9FIRM|nr:ABC transporter permease [Heliophilum fasciatum]MCW2278110.1 NitT/TauT family transport system permease protein [Heliophilum fasciatum]TCP64180.1 NitT/TauT family transport system permease protein [Heliophilum fasciatum]
MWTINLRAQLDGWLAFLLVLLLWTGVAGFYTPEQLPSPLDVLKAFPELWEADMLGKHILVSMGRFLTAYGLAVVIGIPLGLWMGWVTRARQALDPIIQFLRPISPIAWFPLAVLWFGIGNAPAVFIIFLAAFFPVVVTTVSAVRQVNPLYLKVAYDFGAGPLMVFRQVVLPAAFPQMMNGLHIAVGTAWIHLVAGEMLGAQSGLGYFIVDSRNFLRTDWIIAGMIMVGAIGLIINRLMRTAERWIYRQWGQEAGSHE